MALTQQQIVDLLASFGPGLISGFGQAGRESAARAQQQADTQYGRRAGARSDLASFYNSKLTRDINAARDIADQSPLGAEQTFAQQMARRRMAPAMAAQFQNQSGSNPMATAALRGGPNFLAPLASEDYQATVSKDATARSIAERRKTLAGLDPNFQFGSMGDYGLPDLGGEVDQYQSGVRSRRQESETEMQRLLTEQMREASGAQVPGTPATTATTKKKPSMLRRIAGAALPVAAAFLPGGPIASALIQAGAGAAGSALAGGGLKGALTGAAMGGLGAATGGLGSAAGRKVAGETTKSFVQRAILNPRALTQIAGGAMGGDTGAALQAASLGMAGATRPGADAPTQGQTFLETTSPVFGRRLAPQDTSGAPDTGGAWGWGRTGSMPDGIQSLGGPAAFTPTAQFAPSAGASPRARGGRAQLTPQQIEQLVRANPQLAQIYVPMLNLMRARTNNR